jgi:DNA-binding beta-propeller fold protein YncE
MMVFMGTGSTGRACRASGHSDTLAVFKWELWGLMLSTARLSERLATRHAQASPEKRTKTMIKDIPGSAQLWFCLLLLWAPFSAQASEIPAWPLSTLRDIPLPGHSTRWDYVTFDPDSHQLFLAHLGDDTVVVFDTRELRVIATIPQVSQVHGVLYIPELHRLYASATGTDEVVAIDSVSHQIIARIPVGNHPDGLTYVPGEHELFVSDEHGGTDTVIDVLSNTRRATIPLQGQIGNSQYDSASGHVFVNLQTLGQLAEIDPRSHQVLARHPLPKAHGNHGLWVDSVHQLAFVACSDDNTLIVFDLENHRTIATFPVARDPDVLAYDSGLNWLYVAGESGEVSLFQIHGRTVTPLGTAWLGPNAHSVAVDSDTHRAWFPLWNKKGPSVLRITYPTTTSR